jgi:hypothetical protein
MSNIAPITPSYTLSYWKPWRENSDSFDSWTNYIKDVSLAKYTADTIGQYIEQSSKNQILTLNSIGEKLGENLSDISTKVDISNELLSNLNRNLDFLNEQHKVTNLLLGDISKLLRIPDSEKERQHKIELGLKFFANAKIDNDLYHDALEHLLIAESMYKQDYFVLYRIGLIYLHAPNLLDIEKAIDYFKRAAKYSLVETDKKASTLLNILIDRHTQKDDSDKNIFTYKVTVDSERNNTLLIGLINYFDQNGIEILSIDKKDYSYPILFVLKFQGVLNFDDFYAEMHKLYFFERDFKFEAVIESNSLEDSIKIITAESYDKIALSFYLKGDYKEALFFQQKCVQLDKSFSNVANLAKYLVRNNQIEAAKENIRMVLESEFEFLIQFYSDLDFISSEEILTYLNEFQSGLNSNFLKVSDSVNKNVKLNLKINEGDFESYSLSKKIYILSEYKQMLLKLEADEKEYLKTSLFEKKKKEIEYVINLSKIIVDTFRKHVTDRVAEGIRSTGYGNRDEIRLITRQYDGLYLPYPFLDENRRLSFEFRGYLNTKSFYLIDAIHYLIFLNNGWYQSYFISLSLSTDFLNQNKSFNENDLNEIKNIVRLILEIKSKKSDWTYTEIFKDVPLMTNRIDFIINNIGNHDLFIQKNKSSSSNCFIATATIGDYNHPIVTDLQEFRDQYLLNREWGKKFTQWYYVYGRIVAGYIEHSKPLKLISFILLIKPLHMLVKKIYFKSK